VRNTEKGFQNISLAAGDVFKTDFAARGMAAGDLDNDGDADVIISQINGAPVVLRNNGTKNHWIGINLRGEKSAPNGEGSRIIVTDSNGRKQFFDASNSGSYLAANDPRIIVGLGNATSVKQIEIRWTSGKVQTLENPAIDRYHLVNEK
jgi:formylmethanofuran dehydrogenase subunit C